jgi:hypothetical protein
MYAPIGDKPIYVGQAVYSGVRKGGDVALEDDDAEDDRPGTPLCTRLRGDLRSIESASTLDVRRFRFRFLCVRSVWIPFAEQSLIRRFKPVWNLCIDGFGSNVVGGRRLTGARSWWGTLHPGRAGRGRKARAGRTVQDAKARLRAFFAAPAAELAAMTERALLAEAAD